MPTLEDRLAVLEGALSLLQTEQVPNVKQLEQRLNERINVLQQEIAEQKRRLSEQGQKSTSLEKALSQQFAMLNQTLTQNFVATSTRFDEQARATQSQFEDTNMAVTALTVTVRLQGQDIKTMIEDMGIIKEQITDIKQNTDNLHTKFDRLEKLLLERLPPTP